MSRITTTVDNDIPNFSNEVSKVVREAARKAMEFEGQRIRKLVIAQIDGKSLVSTGDLRKSIFSEVFMARGSDFPEVRIGSGLVYGKWVESGTRPHWAPISPLIAWVRRKRASGNFQESGAGFLPRYSKKTGRRLGHRLNQYWEDLFAAKRIQYKIAKYGTRAQPFAAPVFQAERDRVPTRVNASIRRAITKHFRGAS